MKIISEERKVDHSEHLPQIVQRIFAFSKEDPNFPLKGKFGITEGEIIGLKKKLAAQGLLLRQSKDTKRNLIERIKTLEDKNATLREDLLEELGSQ